MFFVRVRVLCPLFGCGLDLRLSVPSNPMAKALVDAHLTLALDEQW